MFRVSFSLLLNTKAVLKWKLKYLTVKVGYVILYAGIIFQNLALQFCVLIIIAINFLGTDTIGCVRTPASFCGILGCRPSHGLVSTIGVLPNSQSLDTVGM